MSAPMSCYFIINNILENGERMLEKPLKVLDFFFIENLHEPWLKHAYCQNLFLISCIYFYTNKIDNITAQAMSPDFRDCAPSHSLAIFCWSWGIFLMGIYAVVDRVEAWDVCFGVYNQLYYYIIWFSLMDTHL